MLLGFISLLLNVLQGATQKICVRQSVMHHLLPCKPPPPGGLAKTAHYGAAVFTGVLGGTRRLLAGGGASDDYCLRKVFRASDVLGLVLLFEHGMGRGKYRTILVHVSLPCYIFDMMCIHIYLSFIFDAFTFLITV